MHLPSHRLLSEYTPLLHAAAFAAERHKYQRRAGFPDLPYINHLLKVAHTLMTVEEEQDLDTLIAALLHDIVEDTPTTLEELAEIFNPRIATIVGQLTDDMRLPYAERKALQLKGVEHLSPAAQKIRIVDKGCNIEDISLYPLNWTQARKRDYLQSAQQIVAPLKGWYPRLDAWFAEQVVQGEERLKG